jgi:imidazolonepropionase-like amidohydrolase
MRAFRFRTYSAGWLAAATLAFLSLSCGSASADTLLLKGATVHPVSGPTLERGEVLIRDGKIAAVGVSVPAGDARVIDLSGRHLYPGFIALNTAMGLMEIGAVRATLDQAESGEFKPDVESWIAVNPDSELIPVARANGITHFQPVPSGGMIAGQSGLVLAEGWTMEQRAYQKPVALHLFWPGMDLSTGGRRGGSRPAKPLEEQAKERRAKLREIDEFFHEARAYAQAQSSAETAGRPRSDRVPAWEAMIPYVRGHLPVMIHAQEERQIRAAVEWAVRQKLKVILAGGRDAALAANLLAQHQIPVVFDQTFAQPARDWDAYDAQFSAAARLFKAGVRFAISAGADTFSAPMVRNLPYSASHAVAFGLPADEALKALTLHPAQIIGVADRLGSIEGGKDASLFAADGDILDLRTRVTHVWINGTAATLETRHTRLYEKYRNRPRP